MSTSVNEGGECRESFVISFADGVCRLMRARSLSDAVIEADRAIAATGRHSATILDYSDYSKVATVRSDGMVIKHQGKA